MNIVEKTKLYQLFTEQREHVLRNKWFLSEKAGYDVGFEKALVDWIVRHRSDYMKTRQTASISNN